MATQTITRKVSDVKGDRGKEVTTWELSVKFDATDAGAQRIVKLLEEKGLGECLRLLESRPVPAATRALTGEEMHGMKVRKWARENGIEVGERGRMGSHVWRAYAEAHSGGRINVR